ncbi:MAG: ion transporter, partial [Clostridia bacterium]|nr:ion transporter [Clostridia bacterium]
MRKRLFEIIEFSSDTDKIGDIYDFIMMFSILLSIIPLAFKTQYHFFIIIEQVTVIIFIFDYLFRIFTADLKLNKGIKSFIYYPFTPLAIIDLLSILPSLTTLNPGFRLFKIFRLFKALKVLKIFKALRYSKNVTLLVRLFKSKKEALLTVCSLAIIYVLVSALVVFNAEPQTFNNY